MINRIRKNYDRTIPTHDYLKYWRVVRYWSQAKYKVSSPDIDMMLFLYSEQLFTQAKFKEYEEIMSWDKPRFFRLKTEGWIIVWRKKTKDQVALYELSYKGKRMINTIYKKLNGEEIGEDKQINPLFRHDAGYADKVYRNMIVKMNKFIRAEKLKGQ